MLGAIFLDGLSDVGRIIKTATREGDRKSLEVRRTGIGGVMQNRSGIDTAAEPRAEWNIREQMSLDRISKQEIELLLCFVQRNIPDLSVGEPPYVSVVTFPSRQSIQSPGAIFRMPSIIVHGLGMKFSER